MKRKKNKITSSDSERDSGSDSDVADHPKVRKKIFISSASDEEDEQVQEARQALRKVVSFPPYRLKESSESDSGGSGSDSSFIDDDDLTSPPSKSQDGGSSDSQESFEPPDPGLTRVRSSSVSCEDENEDEDEDAYGKKLSESQVTSICRLDIATIDAAIRNQRCRRLKEKIQWIVDSYNKIKEDKGSVYSNKQITKHPEVNARDRKHFKGEKFHTMLFAQEVKKAIPFLRDFGVKASSSVIHAVAFHYRTNEVFAVTTGAGWTVVEKYCDFSFSASVAARILSEKGAVESTKKGLVGTEVQSRKVHKLAQQENPFDLLEFCTNYTAEIRPTASIFKLSRFQSNLTLNEDKYEDPESEDDVVELDEDGIPTQSSSKTSPPPSQKFPYHPVSNQKVIVNLRSIRIQTRLSASDRLSMLDILSSIASGKTTYDIYGQIEIDSSAHVKYLTPVDTGSCRDLNLRLSKLIHNALSDRSRDQSKLDDLLNYELIHKHFTRFMNGENFKVIYNSETPSEWPERPPTLKEVVLALRNSSLMQFAPGEHVNHDEAFLKRLEKVKISFNENTSNQVISDKLLNLVDGLLVSDEGGTVHWHVQGRWTLLGSVYLLTVHQEVMKFVRESLVSPSTSGARQYRLHKPWPTLEQIEENDLNDDLEENESRRRCRFSRRFVNSFIDGLVASPDIFVPRDNEGLFDFIRCPSQQNQPCASSSTSRGVPDKGQVILYYIIPSLNYEVVEKGIHISSGIMQIRKAANTGKGRGVAGSEIIKGKLKNIHDDLLENGHEVFKTRFPTLKTFRTALAEATICVGIGKGVNVEDIRRHVPLKRFIRCPDQITMNYIQERLQKQAAHNSCLPNDLELAFYDIHQNDDFLRLSEKLLQEFKKADFVTPNERLTAKILAVTKRSFKFPDKDLSVRLRQFVYANIIEGLQSKGFSLLARLALIRLERTLHETGCPIKLIDIS